jgi:hypothetical protein
LPAAHGTGLRVGGSNIAIGWRAAVFVKDSLKREMRARGFKELGSGPIADVIEANDDTLTARGWASAVLRQVGIRRAAVVLAAAFRGIVRSGGIGSFGNELHRAVSPSRRRWKRRFDDCPPIPATARIQRIRARSARLADRRGPPPLTLSASALTLANSPSNWHGRQCAGAVSGSKTSPSA